jgi:quercetin 2,3-dioxygenase
VTALVLQTVSLGPQWPTIDPFLFCAHHRDAYPAGTAELGPAASLAGRDLGQDFSGRDGWSMYHGQVVPGFPPHPHRGFETVTYVRRGIIDHADSLGAAARFGRGDVQWLTAGRGVVHSEMFPLLDRDGPNPLELFQIWLNLPSRDKLAEPHFTMFWDRDVPRHRSVDDEGRRTEVTVITGALGDAAPPPAPPHSWAARPEADVAIWHVHLEPGARWTMPAAAGADTIRTLYLFDGGGLDIGGEAVGPATGAVVAGDRPAPLRAVGGAADVLVLQGRPIGEPVARYGPFVMNDQAEIQQAFADYQRTGFGGWPWPDQTPVHGPTRGRFARHADGRVEDLDAVAAPTPRPGS